jgi:hypothetical protein
VTATSARAGLAEPVAHGLIRDVQMAVGSYVELRAAGHQAEWPAPVSRTEADHAAALDALAAAATREHENDARDALARVARQPGPRPLTMARARDALLVRTSTTGSIAVLLNVLRATASDARPATIRPGVQAATGEVLPGGVSKTRLAIPWRARSGTRTSSSPAARSCGPASWCAVVTAGSSARSSRCRSRQCSPPAPAWVLTVAS